MPTSRRVLFSIVAESDLRDLLVEELAKHHALLQDISACRGVGLPRTVASSSLVKFEAILTDSAADQLAAVLSDDYYSSFFVIAYQTPIAFLERDPVCPAPCDPATNLPSGTVAVGSARLEAPAR